MTPFRFLLMLMLAGLVGNSDAQTPETSVLVVESRDAADTLSGRFRELSRSLSSADPKRAITARRYSMPEIASDVSRKTGWKVSAVSLKPRNPGLATPDAWEREVLEQFEARNQAGETRERLEHYEVVSQGAERYFRYMKAIVLSKECLACHGERIAPEVKAQLTKHYPHDRSTGYKPGDVRGAVSVKRPL